MAARKIDTIVLSRPDNIGDVVLALPMAGFIKKNMPGIRVIFLGKNYTRPVIQACKYVDEFVSREDFTTHPSLIAIDRTAFIHVFPVKEIAHLAKQLKFPWRIGTMSRLYHWSTCNKLIYLKRKSSNLNEAQLNLRLFRPFGFRKIIPLHEIPALYGLEKTAPLHPSFAALLDPEKYNLVLHPKSNGNGREWDFQGYIDLVQLLDPRKYKIFISGSANEKLVLGPLVDALQGKVTDISGEMELEQFVSFLKECNGIVASSTGPLHLGAAVGIDAMGIFAPIKPKDPGRWAAIGKKAKTFVIDRNCLDCNKDAAPCHCINEIKAEWVRDALNASLPAPGLKV